MYRLLSLLGGAVLLAACSPPPEKTHDWSMQSIEFVPVVYDSVEDVSQAYWDLIDDDGVERDGWAGWSQDERYCEVHTLDLRRQSDTAREELLGHEVWHCIYGNFHPE